MLAWSGWSSVAADAPAGHWRNAAKPTWNRHALTLSYGAVDNPVTLDPGTRWHRTTLGSKGEIDLEYTLVPGSTMDVGIGASRLRGYATLRPAPGTGADGNTLSVSATQWAAHARTRFYRSKRSFPFDPWWGAGLAAGMVDVSEQERAATPGGMVIRPARNTAYSFVGARAMAGLDIRPIRDSSLLLRLQARYDLNGFADGFQGHTNGYALQIGLQWSFWPVAF